MVTMIKWASLAGVLLASAVCVLALEGEDQQEFNPPEPRVRVPSRHHARDTGKDLLELQQEISSMKKVEKDVASNARSSRAASSVWGISKHLEKIVGGTDTEVNEYPWMVAIAREGNDDSKDFFCGGSIINKRWVLTAAHCPITNSDQVIVGAHEWASPPPSKRRVNIASVKDHQSYDGTTLDNDISLVELAEDLDFSVEGIKPVFLPPSGHAATYAGLKATILGWGRTWHDNNNYPGKLQEVEVDVISNARCNEKYGRERITDNMICAGVDEGGKDACQRDSGGPLINEKNGAYTQIGVVSFGMGCGSPDAFGVYARVTRYVDWIISNVGSHGVYQQQS